jgi:hypothetical protein
MMHTFLSQVHKVASAVSKRGRRKKERKRKGKRFLVIKAVQPGASTLEVQSSDGQAVELDVDEVSLQSR